MQKHLIPLLFAGLLLFTTGCGQRVSAVAPEEPPLQETPSADASMAVYDCGGIQIGLPAEYLDRLIIETGSASRSPEEDMPAYPKALMAVYEKASVEDSKADYGNADGIGFLFGFRILDQLGFERHLATDVGGCKVFAREGETYYAMTYPTDVQFYRSDMTAFTPESQDFQDWKTLNALGPAVCEDIIQRNGLTPYSEAELREQSFTYNSQHAYVKYYDYFTFDGSKSEFCTLVLSQPAAQGQGGIWCVERMYDEVGNLYLYFPDTGMAAMEHYERLQMECDTGKREDVLTPLGAAEVFVGEFFGRDAGEDCFEVTAEPDTAYMETNRQMSSLVSSLLAGREIDDMELLECVGGFRTDNWRVLGRNHYGSNWWPPLQAALKNAAVGGGQEARDRNMMKFYLVSYGQYAETIAGCLVEQRASDPQTFEEVLEEFSGAQQTLLLEAVN